MKIKNVFFTLTITVFMTSCATLFTGTKSSVQINSKPSGAKIMVDGIDRGETPSSIKLKRGFSGQTVTLKKEGYETRSFEPVQTFQPVAVLNLFNILFWGIDAATGSIMKYDPKFYEIELEPKKEDKK